jgi:hypothetical protein
MSNTPPSDFYKSQKRYWGNPYAHESDNDSHADVTASAPSDAAAAAAFVAAVNEASSASAATTIDYASEAAPCPLQPCYFDKWDIFADTLDCQYAMGFPVCTFKNLLPIFPISCHLLMSG